MAEVNVFLHNFKTSKLIYLKKNCQSKNSTWVFSNSQNMYLKAQTEGYDVLGWTSAICVLSGKFLNWRYQYCFASQSFKVMVTPIQMYSTIFRYKEV